MVVSGEHFGEFVRHHLVKIVKLVPVRFVVQDGSIAKIQKDLTQKVVRLEPSNTKTS